MTLVFTHSFAGLRSTRPRMEPVRAIVVHTTGGVRPPRGVYETLRQRKGPRSPDGLSIHYIVGSDGEVLQTAPHSLVCLHAGEVNAWTVGIECVSPLLPRTAAAEIERKRGVRRDVYRDRVRGRREIDLLDLTAAQTSATLLLIETLCDQMRIPRVVPTDADGSLLRRQMTAAELASFRGVMGHVHCHPSKLDPGTRVMERLRMRWLAKAA